MNRERLRIGYSELTTRKDWPNLTPDNFIETSAKSGRYNCAAWAVEITDRRWWPIRRYTWPDGVAREETVTSFFAAYATVGFAPCESGNLEEGFQKLAIYVDDDDVPTHVARQLPDGRWASKLGLKFEDIEHTTLNALAGPLYGDARYFMRRSREQQAGATAPAGGDAPDPGGGVPQRDGGALDHNEA